MAPPESVAELLRAMISFDTVTPRSSGRRDAERPLAEWLRQTVEAWGLACEWLPIDASLQSDDGRGDLAPNLLVWPPACEPLAAAGRPWLVFDAHLDTVSHEGMTVPPLGDPSPSGDRIVGRGACDTKGSGAAMLWALKETAEAQSCESPVAVLLTVGEESNQLGAESFARFDASRLRAERGWEVAAVIVGEPTGMNAVAATGGFLRWKITTRGVAAHSSRPERGRNAIDDMVRVLGLLRSEYIERLDVSHPLVGRAACSVTLIEGGVQHNIVPDRCTATIDRRLVPGETAEQELAVVSDLLSTLEADPAGITIEHHRVETADPMWRPENRRLADWAVDALRIAGIPSISAGEPYTTNANRYTAAGLPALVLGPGEISLAHTENESILAAEVVSGVSGFQKLMATWRGFL